MLYQLWITLLPFAWRVALLPIAIEWTPPAGCGGLGCVLLDAGLGLALLAPFAAIARLEGVGLAGLGLTPGTRWRGLAVGLAAAGVVGTWLVVAGGARPLEVGLGVAARHGLAATFEECAYRGFLQRRLAAILGPWPGLVIAAALFAVGHGAALAALYGPGGSAILGPLAYFFLAGCLLGLLFAATRSVWASALPHAAFNILAASRSGSEW